MVLLSLQFAILDCIRRVVDAVLVRLTCLTEKMLRVASGAERAQAHGLALIAEAIKCALYA